MEVLVLGECLLGKSRVDQESLPETLGLLALVPAFLQSVGGARSVLQ